MTERKRVLIVEDEPLIAMMLQDVLEVLGHPVAGVADNRAEALAIVDGGDVDMVILDVHLREGETCWPIADALAKARLPFLLATGGITEEVPAAHRDAPVLAKPFTLESVETALGTIDRAKA